MKRPLLVLALYLLALAGAAAQTNVNWGLATGSNPRNLCVYDATHVCVTTGALDSVAHTFTPVGGGGVTSVGLTMPPIFTVTGSPVTSTGTLAAAFASQSANLFLASPSGASGVPSMRAIVGADVPLATASAQGAMPILNNSSLYFLNGLGAWAIPSGGGGGGGGQTSLTATGVTITGTNTTSTTISSSYTTGASGLATIYINGLTFTDHDANPAFYVTAGTICAASGSCSTAWNSTNAGFSLATTDTATIAYTTGASYLALAGGTMTGELFTSPSTSVTAGLNLGGSGAAPTSPANGDVWITTSGMYARINGVTVGPFSAGGGGGGLTVGTTTIAGGTNGSIEYNNSGVLGELATTGSGNVVRATSPTLVTPALGTPSSLALTNAMGLPISTGVSGLGSGVATALGVNVGSAGAPVLFNGALGTPTSGTLTNATGLPPATGIASGALPPGVTINNSNWSGTGLSLGNQAALTANTVEGNATGSSAVPTALAMPSCSGASNALTYTTSTGFGCNTISTGGVAFPVTVSGTVTSGGIPYFSSTTNMATSAVLAANALMVGGGAGVAPSTVTTGTGVVTALGSNTNATGGVGTVGTSGATVGLLNGVNTHSGMETLAGSSSIPAAVATNIIEPVSVQATALSGSTAATIYPSTASVYNYTANPTAAWTVNIAWSSGTSLNTALATGQAITVVMEVNNGATAYVPSAYQIDGSAVTPNWQGGTAPSAGDASVYDIYTFTVQKTASATYTVFASMTKF